MQIKEEIFDFSKKRSDLINNKKNWITLLQASTSFVVKHKKWFAIGVGVFMFAQTINYLFSDSPEESKSKVIALQVAYSTIPQMNSYLEANKNKYDDVVDYITQKEYDIKSNTMHTMNVHINALKDSNVNFKLHIINKEEKLNIITKKLKETNSFNSLTSGEKEFLLDEYKNYKSKYEYKNEDMIAYINHYTTIEYDDSVSDKIKPELEKERQEIKDNVSVILKKSLKP